MIDYRGFTIEPKRDFEPTSFYVDGGFTKIGYVVVKDSCNAMPGATWFRTIERAKEAVDVLIGGQEPECPGPGCAMCSGEACELCGAGCWNSNPVWHCEHSVDERHCEPVSSVGRQPHKHGNI